jgi:hypothetical protein
MNKKIIKKSVLRNKLRSLPEFKYDIETSVQFLMSHAKQRQFVSFIAVDLTEQLFITASIMKATVLYRLENYILSIAADNI